MLPQFNFNHDYGERNERTSSVPEQVFKLVQLLGVAHGGRVAKQTVERAAGSLRVARFFRGGACGGKLEFVAEVGAGLVADPIGIGDGALIMVGGIVVTAIETTMEVRGTLRAKLFDAGDPLDAVPFRRAAVTLSHIASGYTVEPLS